MGPRGYNGSPGNSGPPGAPGTSGSTSAFGKDCPTCLASIDYQSGNNIIMSFS